MNYRILIWCIYIFGLLIWGLVFADDCVPQFFKITAYYSPVANQDYYAQNTYNDEVKLNGNGTHGAWGKAVFDGMIAAPSKYAFGTKIIIPGFGIWLVEDRGGAIVAGSGWDRIDVWAGSGVVGLQRAYGMWPLSITWYICTGDVDDSNIWFDRPSYDDDYDDVIFWSINQSVWRKDIMVTKLQNILAKYGYLNKDNISNEFDENTRLAVCNYQISKNIYHEISDDCGIWWSKTRSYFKTDLFGDWVKKFVWDNKNILTTKTTPKPNLATKLDLSKTDTKKTTNTNKTTNTDSKTKSTTTKTITKAKVVKVYFDKPIDIWTKSTKVSSLQDVLIGQWIKVKKTWIMDTQTKDWIYELQLKNKLIKASDDKNIRWYMWPSTRTLLDKLYSEL